MDHAARRHPGPRCRDCFEIAIGEPGEALCHECEEAGCEADDGECQVDRYEDECDSLASLAYEDADGDRHHPLVTVDGGEQW